MTAKKITLLDDFFILSEMLNDDIDLICDMMHRCYRVPCVRGRGTGTKCTIKRSKIKRYIQNAQYEKITLEIDTLLSMPITKFKAVKSAILLDREKTEQA